MSSGFLDFVHEVKPDFVEGEIHRKMAAALEWVDVGECKRLMILAPPRHFKSTFARLFARYFVKRRASKNALVCPASPMLTGVVYDGHVYNVCVGESVPSVPADLIVLDGLASCQYMNMHGIESWLAVSVMTRLSKGGSMVMFDSRAGKGDLIDLLLRKQHYGPWTVIALPALGSGDATASGGYWNAGDLSEIRRALPRKEWEAQFQQNVWA